MPIEKFICLKVLNDFEKRTEVAENFYAFKGFLRYVLYLNSNFKDKFNNVQEPPKEEMRDFWNELVVFQNAAVLSNQTEKLKYYSITDESFQEDSKRAVVEKHGNTKFSEKRGKVMKLL